MTATTASHSVTTRRYALRRKLGAGGMGDVWEGFDETLGRRVAVKTLRPELAGDPVMFARFRQEAEAAAGLGHPNIVQVIEFRNEPGEPPLLVMEMLDGVSLRGLLSAEGRLSIARSSFIALQILSALVAAHRARIVHRDIKPGNVFVVPTLAVADFVKVLDFGIAKLLDRDANQPGGPLTQLGDVLGTTAYMAPEQALGLSVDARADLFAVGAILFEAIAGRRPREAGNGDLRAAAFAPCRRLATDAPWAPPGLAAIVDRALALDPKERFASAEEMAAALTPYAQAPATAPEVFADLTVRDVVLPPGTQATAWPSAQPPIPRPAPPRTAPSTPWWVIALPLFAIAVVVAGIGVCILVIVQAYDADESRFLASASLRACASPYACRRAEEPDGAIYDGVEYGICLSPAPAPPETHANGEIVFVADESLTRSARVLAMPDETTYILELADGRQKTMPRARVKGRVCVR